MKAKRFITTIIAAAMITSAMSVNAFAEIAGDALPEDTGFDFMSFEEADEVEDEEYDLDSEEDTEADVSEEDVLEGETEEENNETSSEETATTDEEVENVIDVKGSPDTGIVDVGVAMAGVAILAGGVCLVTGKKQK